MRSGEVITLSLLALGLTLAHGQSYLEHYVFRLSPPSVARQAVDSDEQQPLRSGEIELSQAAGATPNQRKAPLPATAAPGLPLYNGHRLGETKAEFLKADPKIAALYQTCQTQTSKPLTPHEVHLMASDQLMMLMTVPEHILDSPTNRQEYEQLAARGRVYSSRQPGVSLAVWCQKINDSFTGSGDHGFDSTPEIAPPPPSASYTFDQKRLVEIGLFFNDANYQKFVKEITRQAGVSPELSDEIKEGHTQHVFTWRTQKVIIHFVEEDGSPLLFQRISNRSYFEAANQ